MDIELDLEELRENDTEEELTVNDPDGASALEGGEEWADSDANDALQVGRFMPLDDQINLALVESSYGKDLENAIRARG